MIGRKKIKRRPGKKSKNYFTSDTDAAIKEWQNASCDDDKQKIYVARIAPAFDALVTNLMWVYGFKVPRDNPESVKQDCVTFLYEVLDRWDPGYGTKAFSYYNITAKRWLINRSRKALKENKRLVGITDHSALSPWDKSIVESYAVIEAPDENVSADDMKKITQRLLEELEGCAKSDNEKKAAEGVRYLFENAEDLDIFNKRSVIIYLREITGLEQGELSSAMHALRKKYKTLTRQRGLFAYEFWED